MTVTEEDLKEIYLEAGGSHTEADRAIKLVKEVAGKMEAESGVPIVLADPTTSHTTIDVMDKGVVKELQGEMLDVLETWARERGLSTKYVGADFDKNMATMKIGLVIQRFDDDGELLDADASNYIAYHENHHLQKEWLGDEVIIDGSMYEIVGINPRNRRSPIMLLHNSTGKKVSVPSSKILDFYETKKREEAERAVVEARHAPESTREDTPVIEKIVTRVEGLGDEW
jgi:hypothetical protein